MSRYIDADAAKIDAEERGGTLWLTEGDVKEVKRFLDDQPTADVAPVVHAHWIDSPNIMECVVCSNCFSDDLSAQVVAPPPADYKFCPSCGARMDEEEEKKGGVIS